MTSGDILSLVGALAIVFLTGFLCMTLYYAVLILRRVHRTLNSAEEKIDSLFDSWKELHARFLGLKTSLDLIASGCKAALSLYQRRIVKDMSDTDDEEKKSSSKRKDKKNT